MNAAAERPIIVGVTGAGENTAALRFAAEQASRDGAEILLVHAVHVLPPPPPPKPLISDKSLDEVGNQIVKEVGEELDRLTDGVGVSGLARPGTPVQVLVDLSAQARLAVLQHRDLGKLTRIFTGSTAVGLAGHAHCPVVSVPATWTPPPSRQRVTVGVHETGAPRAVLETAFAEAASRGCPLRVVHAWNVEKAYDDIINRQVSEGWRGHGEKLLLDAIDDLQAAYPDVRAEAEVRKQWPAEALVEESAKSDLLVLGRHGRRALPQRVGSIARTLIREARCPVMVVPVSPEPELGEEEPLLAQEVSPQT